MAKWVEDKCASCKWWSMSSYLTDTRCKDCFIHDYHAWTPKEETQMESKIKKWLPGPGYRKFIIYIIAIIIAAICGFFMKEVNYKTFLEAITIITCGFFVGNAAGKFIKKPEIRGE